MKRIKIIIALVMAFLMIVPTFAMAEETVPEEPPAEEPVVEEPQEEEPVEEEPWLFESVLGDITEDSPLYPVRAQLESITIVVETDESGLSSLVITFTDQTIFEDEIITEEMLEELRAALLKKIEAYLNGEEEPVEEEPEEIVEPVVEEVPGADPVEPTEEEPVVEEPIVEEPEEEPTEEIPDVSLIIELGEGLTEEQAAAIVEIAVREISGLFVTEAFTTVKEAFFDAKVDLIQAMNAWKESRKNGTDEEEQAAYEALMAAREYKEEMEALKDAVELLKEEVKLLLGDEEDGDGPPWDENPSIMNKLESNGIGNGLIKVKGEKPEKEEKPEKGKPGK